MTKDEDVQSFSSSTGASEEDIPWGTWQCSDEPVNEFDVTVQKEGEWFVAYCWAIPEANGQGKTKEAALNNLRDAILLILQDRLEDSASQRIPEAVDHERIRVP